jgi:hypothetical protein
MLNMMRAPLPWIALACLPGAVIQAQTINSLSPSSTQAGGPAFSLTLNGVGLNSVDGAPKVLWNGQNLNVTSSSGSQITATVPSSLIASAGTANVQAQVAFYCPGPMYPCSYNNSNTVPFTITASSSSTPFTLSVTTVTFQFAAGNGVQTQQVQVGSKSGAHLSFGAGSQLTSPAQNNWLSVNPPGGVTPATLNVTANPSGLRPGTYTGLVRISLAGGSASPKSPARDAAGDDATIAVVLQVSDTSMSFTFLVGGPRPATKTLTVSALSATNVRFFATAAVAASASKVWLSVSPTDTNAPADLKVSVDPSGLTAGTYVGGITLSPFDATGTARQVPVTLTVVGRPDQTLSFSYQAGASIPTPQTLPLTSNGGPVSLNAEAFSDGNWLAVSPSSGTTPVTLSCSVSPAGLAPKTYAGLVAVTDLTSATIYVVQVTLTVTPGVSMNQMISHIADGAKWKTTIILINLDTSPASFTLNFWRDNGAAFPISLTGRGTLATVTDTIPVGGSRTIESDGTASTLSTGWAEVISSQSVGGTAIFRDQNLNQEAAVPLLAGSAARLLLPFDTGGLSLGVALANPSQVQDVIVTRTLRNGQGQVITSDSVTLAHHGHTAFVLANPSNKPEDQRGVLELSSTSGQFFALGIRGNNGAFTSIEALSPQDPKTKVISHIANGARWKTTIVLVNTDSVPVQFTVNFWKDDGTPFTVTLVDGRSLAQVTDAIPVGGSRTIETDGLASTLATGWAEVLSSQSVSGTAIFRDQTLRQEAAVPLLTSGGTRLVLPFDKGLDLGVALANSNLTQDAGITRTLRNEQGQMITSDALLEQRRAHTSFLLANPSTRTEDQRGVVEFSSGVEFYSLGIRGNNGAFTSIRALSK